LAFTTDSLRTLFEDCGLSTVEATYRFPAQVVSQQDPGGKEAPAFLNVNILARKPDDWRDFIGYRHWLAARNSRVTRQGWSMEDSATFAAWNAIEETLEQVEGRIHDGVPREQLRERGRVYAQLIFDMFPWYRVASGGAPVEVGPGVGYVMEAFAEIANVSAVVGLDISTGMIAHARARLKRDGLSPERFVFQDYDGKRFPWNDNSVGAFYSVATMQHIPKPFAYNILFEIERCLVPGGCAALHFLAWSHLPRTVIPIRDEIANQIEHLTGHRHHYWDRIEAEALMMHGVRPRYFNAREDHDSLWLGWIK